ncbi:MAG: hypothetical protein J0M17_09830 [Planctomycetes bacterium]|nr:hypothetical protein [Planctomycetota bacterium]
MGGERHDLYPNGRELFYGYGATDSYDDRPPRVFALQGELPSSSSSSGAVETYVEYTYVGLGSFVRADYTEPQVRWDLITGSSANPYAGLDRFGRVIDCLWRDYSASGDGERVKYG